MFAIGIVIGGKIVELLNRLQNALLSRFRQGGDASGEQDSSANESGAEGIIEIGNRLALNEI